MLLTTKLSDRNIWSMSSIPVVTQLVFSISHFLLVSITPSGGQSVTQNIPGATSLGAVSGLTPKSKSEVFTLEMPGVVTREEDGYMCTMFQLPFTGKHYIIGFEAKPDNPDVHHMILSTCAGRPSNPGTYKTCSDECQSKKIYFAWGRHAPATNLPKGVGFVIGAEGSDYLELQVHYRTIVTVPDRTKLKLTVTPEPQPNVAGVLLLTSSDIKIPSHTKRVIGNVSCRYESDVDLHPFAYRVHAHMLGKVISGYLKHNLSWTKIGKASPQWPQAFWPVTERDLVIRKGDYLTSKCVYSSENYDSDVNIGATHNDEMCNFYIMYYKNSTATKQTPDFCLDDAFPEISEATPPESLQPLPPNPDLDAIAEGHHHHQGHQPDGHVVAMDNKVELLPTPDWPILPENFKFGQVAGLATDSGFVYVFHRGNTVWDENSFDFKDDYLKKDLGPIKEKTLVQLNSTSGKSIYLWGSDFFYMPHGLFVDRDGSFWVTDVAMHQVFKLSESSKTDAGPLKPMITLGTKFVPGSDREHFCKPTDVATLVTGEVFVTDGYCNRRVISFDRFGIYQISWDIESAQNVLPHSISVDTTNNLLYVAERLGASILVYDTSGKFVKKITNDRFKPQLFAVSYSSSKDKLFCVNGEIIPDSAKSVYDFHIMVLDPNSGMLLSEWNLPKSFNKFVFPHDLAVSPDGSTVYVAEPGAERPLLKFESPTNSYFGVDGKPPKKVTYHRHPVGAVNKPAANGFDDEDQDEERKRLMTKAFVVVLCLLVIPLSVVVGIALYMKNKRQNRDGYSHMEAAQQCNRRLNGKKPSEIVKTFVSGKGSLPDNAREEELKRLESESEEEFTAPSISPGQI